MSKKFKLPYHVLTNFQRNQKCNYSEGGQNKFRGKTNWFLASAVVISSLHCPWHVPQNKDVE